ncbi:MAG: hypothetical protein COX77_03135 [Candidatus Komeilibacteria bacterium CG_4_10_14_0_2_um_filter_37_10]|uniref:Quinate/shikimate 5-dehydrogenase/glutamyl-tRNA reductase domain-containing protein n=1 Tax=Candidatus Komeilibacteria bacterium CG_4_10_14_0_2_um_filter_37_10 TaxID=1974470 RepID=A0A2M7VEF2_9BACT|nr:MAG: hypothetical protein COX77_03135 [Candidatus Komeilibacteria bacterium CG_4_10_14_0_2_um_filter_37_10]PJA92909.1 MAG: hypothetical protein CO133_01525 [Candidatus Komeilibacteria bacterium CG_4_9_14_3_um_filter_37_5]
MPKVNLAFITNTRSEIDRDIVYAHHFVETGNKFVPDIFNWKKVNITIGDQCLSSQMVVIGSSTADLYSGLRNESVSDARQKKEILERIHQGKTQTRLAIVHALDDLRADVICFGASTKNLLKVPELQQLNGQHTSVFTLGDSYTAAVCVEQIKKACERGGVDFYSPQTNFLIVGAYGLLGRLVSRYFSQFACQLLLVGRDITQLKKLTTELKSSCRFRLYQKCTDVNEQVHLLFTATNSPESIITPHLIKDWGGKILALDVAEPPNITPDVCQRSGSGFLRLDAGVVRNDTLYFENGNQMGLRDNTIFACFAEGFIVAHLLAQKQLSLPAYDLMKVREDYFANLLAYADQCGFILHDFQSFGQIITAEQWRKFITVA